MIVHFTEEQATGFTPDRDNVKSVAFKLAYQLGIQHTFNPGDDMAGYDWLQSLSRQNPQLSVG